MSYTQHLEIPYRLFIRKIDGRWHVVALADDVEHTHHEGFRHFMRASSLRDAIACGLALGRDLNLTHWDSTTTTPAYWA